MCFCCFPRRWPRQRLSWEYLTVFGDHGDSDQDGLDHRLGSPGGRDLPEQIPKDGRRHGEEFSEDPAGRRPGEHSAPVAPVLVPGGHGRAQWEDIFVESLGHALDCRWNLRSEQLPVPFGVVQARGVSGVAECRFGVCFDQIPQELNIYDWNRSSIDPAVHCMRGARERATAWMTAARSAC